MERREFLKAASAAGLGAAAVPSASAQNGQASPKPNNSRRPEAPGMIYRELGTTGERVSAIGMGGYHLGKSQLTQAESIRLLHAGIDAGITFLDNCWDYNDGISEVRVGWGLRENSYRDKVFLMTKIDGRTAEEYDRQLEQSMGRLQTEMIDLVQFHECIRLEDPDRIFAKGGAIDAARRARDAGKIRYIGFTGHKDPAVHLRMFEVAEKNGFHFDTVQMPVNVMDAHFRSFTRNVIPVAVKHGTGVLAMKTFGDHYILDSNTVQPMEALHYGLSQQVSVVITGIDTQPVLEQALTAARTFKPMTQEAQAALLSRTETAAAEGKYELFKISSHFDGTAQNPKWLGQDLTGKAS